MLSDIIKCVIIVGAAASLASPVEKDTFVTPISLEEDSISGGYSVSIKDFPYQVSIYIGRGDQNDRFHCGGSIISNNYILTAAHCLDGVKVSQIVVRAGSAYQKKGTIIKITDMILHSDYSINTIDNDVAVIRAAAPIEFNDVIQPIRLPNNNRPLEVGSIITASGWGETESSAESNILLAVKVPVVSEERCYRVFPDRLTKNMFCAGGLQTGGKAVCQGDSGGPAVQNGVQYGIVSWGRPCALPNFPDVYTKIQAPSIRGFIAKHTGVEQQYSRVGSADLKTGTLIKIADMILHPDYIKETIDNDVAVMKTATPIEFNDVIQPIKLPNNYGSLEDGSTITVSGWGRTENLVGSDTLLAVKVPVVNDKKCQKLLSDLETKLTKEQTYKSYHIVNINQLTMFSDIIKCVIIVDAVASLASPVEKDTFVTQTSIDKDSIYGGYNASIKDFPYQVSIYIGRGDQNDHFQCGGSIISTNYILTAAHCLHYWQVSQVVARAGSAYQKKGTIIKIAYMILHPNYVSLTYDNDVAVMKTATPIEFNDVTQPIRLPNNNRPLEDGSIITVSGWGQTESSAGSKILLAVKVPVVSDERCYGVFGNNLTKSMFCAGGLQTGGKAVCYGDSGGPAVQNGVQYGIVSWGEPCALPNYPDVYTKILEPSIRGFIAKHTGV
ncbi:transmembrane protease serine 9-like [Anticarsia gemmatalis]|uniref:transmembrane protease serine 9-like n=1 Tax=Anticarsia gemmatalis TaxID=129554 RepID=UPI003F759E7D